MPRIPKSARTGMRWPAVASQRAAAVLALQHQFDQSQWWAPEILLDAQLRQLELVLAHAAQTVPFYCGRLKAVAHLLRGELTLDTWRRLPILRRRDIQEAGPALVSRSLPEDHGRAKDVRTSGSTGRPITVKATAVTSLLFSATNLRYHLWHGRDFAGTVASIRVLRGRRAAAAAEGKSSSWVPGYPSGPLHSLDITKPVGEQLDWLVELAPDYLLTFPSNLAALVRRSADTGSRPAGLRGVSTMSEVLEPEVRTVCDKVWGVPVRSTYSAQEVGTIALQCPERPHYHVQAENVLVEVLGEDGAPRGPGERGRVLVSSLNNFATPLIRYEVGDYAEVGEPCPCGRGLPVLKRILGRSRNMLSFPSGEQIWPRLRTRSFTDIAQIRQYQFVQHDLTHIEGRLVTVRELTPEEESKLRELILSKIGHPFKLTFTYHDEIPRSASGKYEEFVSTIDHRTG